MVYHKNIKSREKPETIEELLNIHHIPQVLAELKEEPFKKLPSTVLVDLYEYVESLNFGQVEDLLGENYKGKFSSREEERNFDRFI